MLHTYLFYKAVCPLLLDELVVAGVPVTLDDKTSVVTYLDANQTENGVAMVWIQADEAQYDTVAQVVAAHNPNGLRNQQAADSTVDTDLHTTIRNALDRLAEEETRLTTPTALTAADTRRILLLLVRCVTGLVKLVLRRL